MNEYEFRIHMRMLDIIERGMLKKPLKIEPPQEFMEHKPAPVDSFFVDKRVDDDLLKAMSGFIEDDTLEG